MQVFFSSSSSTQKPNLSEIREKSAVTRAQLVRQNHGYIPETAYNQRKAFFVAKVDTPLCRCCDSIHTRKALAGHS